MIVTSPTVTAGAGALLAANNLSDIASAQAAIANLGLAMVGKFRAPRGGLAFDGSGSMRAYAALTGQNIGTDDFSVSISFRCPTSVDNVKGVICIGPSAGDNSQANAFQMDISGPGELQVGLRSPTAGDVRMQVLAGFVATYGGTVVNVIATRAAGTMRVYVNGILQTTVDTVIAGSPPAGYYASVSSSYMLLGYLDVGNPPFNLVTVIYAASLYNLALLQADITEIFELGGAVPERFKTGSQAAVISNTFNNEQAGWGGFNGATLTNNAGYVAYNGSGDIRHPYNAKPNQLWRAALECFSTVANNITFYSETGSQITFAVPGDSTWHTYTGIFRSDGQEATGYLGAAINSSLAIRLRNYSLKQVGAICHFDGDTANPSAQWLDSLGNSLHGLRTFTGTAPTKLVIGPFPVRLASDGTTTAQQLGGGTLLPANCQLVRVRARARTGTPSITLGTTSGGADIVASVALSTTWKDLTIALTGGILSAATPVWLTASAANVVEVQIAAEVLSA